LGLLPPVTKTALMQRFHDWVADPAFTRDAVEAFVAEPGTIGSDFLGRYVVFTTSGPPSSGAGRPGRTFGGGDDRAGVRLLAVQGVEHLECGGGQREHRPRYVQPAEFAAPTVNSRRSSLAARRGHRPLCPPIR
jgi:hypothetical protein